MASDLLFSPLFCSTPGRAATSSEVIFSLMVLLIDNYDSFVFNLARYLRELGCDTRVVRNDELTISQVEELHPQAIVISPGPCSPTEAGISIELIRQLHSRIPMLGVCLGHQAIGAAFGAVVRRAPEPVHGRTSPIRHCESGVFNQIPNPFIATRYHSLIVEENTLPPDLLVTARTVDHLVMGLQHRTSPLFGVQFHPESVLTEGGHQLLANFLTLAGITPGPLPAGDALGASNSDLLELEDLEDAIDSRWVEQQAHSPLHW